VSAAFRPAGHLGLRGKGLNAWPGWPTMPKAEELRQAWFAAPGLAVQQRIAAAIRTEAFQQLPNLPVGQHLQPRSYRSNLSGVLKGIPLF
jgi:peptide/nickel transport system substrate-binding protein